MKLSLLSASLLLSTSLVASCSAPRPYVEAGAGFETQAEKTYGRNPVGHAAIGLEWRFEPRTACDLSYTHHSSIPDYYDRATTDMIVGKCRFYMRKW